MKAIVIRGPGEADVLQVAQRPVPEPRPGEVLIRVMAAGLNRPDIAQRKGRYPAPPGAPADIPGLEVAGIVESVFSGTPGEADSGPAEPQRGRADDPHAGQTAGRWKPGDRVCALVSGGGYAEYCCVPEEQCLPVPENLSFTEAAALPETFFTVWSNVFERGGLQRGDRFLVHGGSGGIGTTAIQLARAWGCEVYTTAGTAEKCRFCEELGASRSINYREEDFEAVLHGLYPRPSVNVILDMIGGDYTAKNLRLLAMEGRLVQINSMKGREASIDLLAVMRRRLVVTGSTLRSREPAFKGMIARALEEQVWPLLATGIVRPVIHSTFSLVDAADAHRLMERGGHLGKIVLEIR